MFCSASYNALVFRNAQFHNGQLLVLIIAVVRHIVDDHRRKIRSLFGNRYVRIAQVTTPDRFVARRIIVVVEKTLIITAVVRA